MATATVTIDGFLSKDSTLRFTQSGAAVLGFSIPVTPQKKTDSGWEDTGPTQWYDCSIWGGLAETYSALLVKSTRVKITGNLTTREHEGKTYQQVRVDQLGIIPRRDSTQSGSSGGFARGQQGQQADDPWKTAGPADNGFDSRPPF